MVTDYRCPAVVWPWGAKGESCSSVPLLEVMVTDGVALLVRQGSQAVNWLNKNQDGFACEYTDGGGRGRILPPPLASASMMEVLESSLTLCFDPWSLSTPVQPSRAQGAHDREQRRPAAAGLVGCEASLPVGYKLISSWR